MPFLNEKASRKFNTQHPFLVGEKGDGHTLKIAKHTY